MDLEKYMFPCLSKTLFGIECLGCGFQRSLILLSKGNFDGAFNMYPAIYSSLLFLAVLGFYALKKNFILKNILIITAIINVLFMTIGYYYKHF